MPIHDWSGASRAAFHNFYLGWTAGISAALNSGLLPPNHYYSLTENIRDGRKTAFEQIQERDVAPARPEQPEGLLYYPESQPQTSHRDVCLEKEYAEKVITIRECSYENVVAAIRIVTAETKRSRYRLDQFVGWAVEAIRDGVSLLLIDPFPPGPLNPHGIHKAIWDEFVDNDFTLPTSRPVTLAAYVGGCIPEAFVEPVAFGSPLPEMPLFLNSGMFLRLPLEPSYQANWDRLPEPLRPPQG
jgi:hypothetical protein